MSRATVQPTKHARIRDALLRRIRRLPRQAQLPSERQLAAKHRVCRATVNKVMTELEQEGYLVRHPGKGAFAIPPDKEVFGSARQGRRQASVVMAYPDYFSYTTWQRVHSAEQLALREGIHLINFKFQQLMTLDPLFAFLEQSSDIDGLIIQYPVDMTSRSVLERFDRLGFPVVFLGTGIPVNLYRNLYLAGPDYVKSGYLKMSVLIENGHRDLAYVGVERVAGSTALSRRGMKRALYDFGMKWSDVVRLEIRNDDSRSTLQRGYDLTRELLAEGADASGFLYDTFQGAFGGMRAFREHGVRLPEDVSLVCGLAHFGYETMTCPSLTNVTSDPEALLALAMDIIQSPDDHPERIRSIDVVLNMRESVARRSDG